MSKYTWMTLSLSSIRSMSALFFVDMSAAASTTLLYRRCTRWTCLSRSWSGVLSKAFSIRLTLNLLDPLCAFRPGGRVGM